ncbi:rhodoquinone biosynthesis methyltransferase RquA [Aromatoleum sp.]|uniref:rhodoquinone biosynthesis methyltransferase RquA n=1 Tax=Aromatoleum sp. TaxID=2307007 RepID=UPI002FCC3D0A
MPRDPPLRAALRPMADGVGIPKYLSRTYTWAYLNPRTLGLLDRPAVVSAILWGNANRLMRDAVAEFSAGQCVLQAACVYGAFSRMLAERVGASGALEIVDVAALQIANARRKLAGLDHVVLRQADLSLPGCLRADSHDAVCCFFLLHEMPEKERRRVVDNLLGAVRPRGKIVFVDYHRPRRWHPLAPVMRAVFRWLEPYAPSLFERNIESRSPRAADFEWKKTTCFGGLYQKLVGVRRG